MACIPINFLSKHMNSKLKYFGRLSWPGKGHFQSYPKCVAHRPCILEFFSSFSHSLSLFSLSLSLLSCPGKGPSQSYLKYVAHRPGKACTLEFFLPFHFHFSRYHFLLTFGLAKALSNLICSVLLLLISLNEKISCIFMKGRLSQ